jgi:hypothetical protein
VCCFSLFCCTTLLRRTLLDYKCYRAKHVFCPLPKITFFLFRFSSLLLCCRGDWVSFLLSLLSRYGSLPASLSLDMAPTNKKWALPVPSCSDSTKQAAVARAPKRPASKSPMKKPAAKKLSSLGFSSTKRQLYQPGTKILLIDAFMMMRFWSTVSVVNVITRNYTRYEGKSHCLVPWEAITMTRTMTD